MDVADVTADLGYRLPEGYGRPVRYGVGLGVEASGVDLRSRPRARGLRLEVLRGEVHLLLVGPRSPSASAASARR